MVSSTKKQSKRATIRDVADVAQVSVTTVSNALNGRTEAMTGETLHRIQQAIDALSYRPNNVARSLVTQQTATIGVIIAEIDTTLFLQALAIIEPIARSANYNILLGTVSDDLHDEEHTVDLLIEKQVEGIVYLSTSAHLSDDYLAKLPPSLPPMVLINRSTASNERFDYLDFDNVAGLVDAVDYLVRLGHRHIAHMSGAPAKKSTTARIEGYKLGLARHGLEFRPDYLRPGCLETTGQVSEDACLELLALSPRPTAIIAATDIVGAYVLRTIQRAGLRVPDDISVIGVDDQPLCTYLNPALTTVRMPIAEAGQLAIEMLLARIAGAGEQTRHITMPCPLIVRESTSMAVEAVPLG
jgi:LacI family transcriptional regulator